MIARLPPRPLVVAAVLALVLVACQSGDGPSDAGAGGEGRVEAIVEARDAVVEPAQALGTAAAEVASRLDELVARPDDGAIAATGQALEELAAARDTVRGLELDTSVTDVRDAADALARAVDGADGLDASTATVVEAAGVATEVEAELEALVAAWDERGSRSELLARFDEVAARADELATTSTVDGCPGPMEERVAAAEHVATATRELRDLVAARDGNGFDARRAELDEAPFGLGPGDVPRGTGSSIVAESCPAVAEAEDAASTVAEALRSLQDALNPSDLAS